MIERVLILKFLPHYLVIPESKINAEFPNTQFFIKNYDKRNRKDRNKHGWGLIKFVRKGLIWNRLETPKTVSREIKASEITVKNKKSAKVSAYRPLNNFNICDFFNSLSLTFKKISAFLIILCSWVILIFILRVRKILTLKLYNFWDTFGLTNLVEDHACFAKKTQIFDWFNSW